MKQTALVSCLFAASVLSSPIAHAGKCDIVFFNSTESKLSTSGNVFNRFSRWVRSTPPRTQQNPIRTSLFENSRTRLAKTEEGALRIQRNDPSTAGLIKFNEFIDNDIRSNPDYALDLLSLALNRLPYLKNEPFNLVLSGGVVEPWLPKLQEAVHNQGLDVNFILLSGSLSFARSDRRDIPEFPIEAQGLVQSRPTIFMDDTYTNGGTAQAVRLKLQEYRGDLDGVFVVYEGGKGDPASLYKSGRMNQRPPSMGQFPHSPSNWKNLAGVQKIGVELDGTIYVSGTNRVTEQAALLFENLAKMNIEVTILKNGKHIDPPAHLKQTFSRIRFSSDGFYDLAIGNWGRQFLGVESEVHGRPNGPAIETALISSFRDWGKMDPSLLDKNYFLNRLSEEGVFAPEFNRKPSTLVDTRQPGLVVDLRHVKNQTLPVQEILQIENPKERVRQLSLLDGENLSMDEKSLLIDLASMTSNSFEMGALIKLSSQTSDPRWIPILEKWHAEWRDVERGWQTFLRTEVETHLNRLKSNLRTQNSGQPPMSDAFSSVAMENTINRGELRLGMLPRGSALLTSSGALKESGITAIVHAATGSMTQRGSHFEPTIESLRSSISNAVSLAEKNGHQRIAIPLVGGGIFLSRLGIDQTSLAKEIVSAAVQACNNCSLRFVGFSDVEVNAFRTAISPYKTQLPPGAIEALQGSLTDGHLHKSTAIVNAANTEVRFGGGLSGAIGNASKNAEGINKEAQDLIQNLAQEP